MNMSDFISYIVKAILESDNFKITEKEENNQLIITILVEEDQIGKIVGKEGRVINSIRCLAKIKAKNTYQNLLITVDKLS